MKIKQANIFQFYQHKNFTAMSEEQLNEKKTALFYVRRILRSIIFIVIGISAIVFANEIDDKGSPWPAECQSYGGDAYTGIQNAAAITSENVAYMNRTLKLGFQYTLLIAGVAFIAFGATTDIKED